MPQRDLIYDIAAFLLDCACTSLATTDGGCPDRRCVVPGGEAEAVNCCDGVNGGQLTVNWTRIFPTRSFPVPDQGSPNNCDAAHTVALYHIDIFRCMPTGQMEFAPTCDELDDAARMNMQDAWAIRNGVTCCLRDEELSVPVIGRGYRWSLGEQVPLGPSGSCVGARLEVAIGYLTCWECP
jgi:hypothetical protein